MKNSASIACALSRNSKLLANVRNHDVAGVHNENDLNMLNMAHTSTFVRLMYSHSQLSRTDPNPTTSAPIMEGPPVMPLYHPLKRPSEQPDCDTASQSQPGQHQEKTFPGHSLPKRTQKPREVVAEETG